ncbi:MAG: anthranilate synthase component I family protein [Terriglobia bacterium]
MPVIVRRDEKGMPTDNLSELLCQAPETRPVLLEGRWLGEPGDPCWAAKDPASILEGSGEALPELPAWLDWHSRKYPDGAAVGFLSYELSRHFESLRLTPHSSLPDFSFAYYPRVQRLVVRKTAQPSAGRAIPIHSNFDFENYCKAVERVRKYIAAGDIYQANLTIQFRADLGNEVPESIYHRVRRSGAPFRAFLKTPGRTILSNSPERFFRVSGNHILTSPIKGTIARNSHDSDGSKARLLSSHKDRAENVMIVDLLRNDLGRICRYESIRARLWEIETLPQLFHLVSHVAGTLRPEAGILEILRALFPCGSITGAPKIRAMEILSEIERAPRGVSMGAIGIIRGDPGSDRCKMDFNVSIRTTVIEKGIALFNVGGGIVCDSNPLSEYEEVMLKAQPLFDALGALQPRQARPTLSTTPTTTHQHGFPHLS